MSASLVGSEMCIRDSTPLGTPQTPPENRSLLRGNAGNLSAPRRSKPADACLLYTSDAADDM
eukprot:245572-Alexandrium_andersonii.AAC.1